MLLKLLREGLGRLIVAISWIFSPKKIQRPPESQQSVDAAAANLSLYQFYACPFCIKTRRTIHRLNLPIAYRDAQTGIYRDELSREGGRIKVPCLRIENSGKIEWMYESNDIIAYLEHNFSTE